MDTSLSLYPLAPICLAAAGLLAVTVHDRLRAAPDDRSEQPPRCGRICRRAARGRHARVDQFHLLRNARRAADEGRLRDGHQEHKFTTPWYQYPVMDFFAENLWPFEVRDERILDFELAAAEVGSARRR